MRSCLASLHCTLFKFSSNHRILGLNLGCTLQQVKSAYYKKAHLYHPDKNPDANAKQQFSILTVAYERLTEELKRNPKGSSTSSASSTSTNSGPFTQSKTSQEKKTARAAHSYNPQEDPFYQYYSAFARDFEEAMKRKANEYQQRKAREQKSEHRQTEQDPRRKKYQRRATYKEQANNLDIKVNVEISAEELLDGCTKEFKIQKTVACQCGKNGKTGCKTCKGTGFVIQHLKGYGGVEEVCMKCHGEGHTRFNCRECRGKGYVKIEVLERLKIPRGCEPNTTLKFKGKGKSLNQRTGDLLVKLVNKLRGERKDNDFYSTHKISIADAVLGCSIEVDTLLGTKFVQLPKAVTHGHIITLTGHVIATLMQGYEDGKSTRKGNHYVTIHIDIPSNVSGREEELYAELKQLRKKSKRHESF